MHGVVVGCAVAGYALGIDPGLVGYITCLHTMEEMPTILGGPDASIPMVGIVGTVSKWVLSGSKCIMHLPRGATHSRLAKRSWASYIDSGSGSECVK